MSRKVAGDMESGHHLFFDPSCHGGTGSNVMFLGSGNSVFRGSRSVMMNMEETLRKRPFFSSQDDLLDDEYYDDQSSEKKRRLTVEQVHMLEKSFETENKLEPERKSQLAKNLGLQPRQVAIWFQNRRARWKTKQLERDFDQLKSSYESLLSDYEAIRKETDKLKDERLLCRDSRRDIHCSSGTRTVSLTATVISLTEKLPPKEEVLVVMVPKPDSFPTDLSRPSSIDTEVVDEVNDPFGANGHSKFPIGDTGFSRDQDDGSTGVVDEVDGPMQQLMDRDASYFTNHGRSYSVGDMGMSGEDDGSDDGGQIYFFDTYVAASEQQHHCEDEEEGYSFGWWVWS